jgi:hypothetical protein
MAEHHLFINYRVATEGQQISHSSVFLFFNHLKYFNFNLLQEPAGGLIQFLYEELTVRKKKSGAPVVVYWDKKCLNFGQNWEAGFLNGLKKSHAIILLISNKV